MWFEDLIFRGSSRWLALAGVLLLAIVSSASAQVGVVNVTACPSPASSCTIPSSGAGHLIVVGWASSGTAPAISAVTDNAGNVYTAASNARAVNSTNDMVDFWYAANSNAGATIITVTTSPGGSVGSAEIWEFSGVVTASPLGQTAVLNSQPTSTTPAGASVTTTAPGVVVSALVSSASITGLQSGNPFTTDSASGGTGWANLVTSSGWTYSPQWLTSSSGTYASSTVSFKAATSVVVTAGSSGPCDLNNDDTVNVLDVQLASDMYSGLLTCSAGVDGLGICNSTVVQRVVTAALGGACVVNHSVILNWTASTTPTVTGYNVYRSSTAGGPYTLLSSSVGAITYTDSNGIVSGQTYYYVTTAVDGSGSESAYSNQAEAVIPYP